MDDPLALLVGGRVEGAFVTPETGLVGLTVWCPGGARRLVVGVGPRVVGVGWAQREPAYRAPGTHPLVAALRAHAVGRTVRAAHRDDDEAVWIDLGDERVSARVRLQPGALGEARVLDDAGAVRLAWRGDAGAVPRAFDAGAAHATWEAAGEGLRAMSDALAGELRRAALARALGALARRLAKRAAAVEADLARLDDVERLQRVGRLLLAQGDRVPRGAKRAVLEDWEVGGTVEVLLDPATTAKSQAAGYFQKARRIQRGGAVMWERLEVTTRALEAARALLAEVDGEGEVVAAALKAWGERAEALGVARAQMAASRGRAKAAPRRPYIEYRGAGERAIYVGRGAADNDRLTTKVARMHDLWMHARGVTGAHVVVPMVKGAECPPALLLDAATLAVHHSDARGADFAEVTWAERRYVRKPKGSPAGRVVVDREKVLALGANPERLRRLLAARVEG
jgi:hypothetical protein